MRSFFDFLTRMALRFRAITLIIVVVVMGLGGVAATELQQELLPPIEFPQSIVLIQVSGMTSEEALNVVTLRVEDAVNEVPGVVNIESQTSAQIGAFLSVSTEFGEDQDAIRADIQAALDSVFLPGRVIQAPEGQDSTEFAASLLADMTPDVLLHIARRNPSFLFQLTPDVWASFSEETVSTLLAYLAAQTDDSADNASALERLVEAELVPQVDTLDLIARVEISGGQTLPDDNAPEMQAAEVPANTEAESLLLQLSDEVWAVVASRLNLGDLNADTANQLADASIEAPTTPPTLPESWQKDHFNDASDLLEMASFTRSIAGVFNEFQENGLIRGALAQTDDLSPEAVQTMLEIQPSLATYFSGEQLAAMSPDVLDVLREFVELDGLSRDALASAILARELTGDVQLGTPENLPAPWRLNPPTIISFSFADLPLATFSVFSTASPTEAPTVADEDTVTTEDTDETPATDPTAGFEIAVNPDFADIPEGPALPALYAFIGDTFGYTLDTADDLLKIQFPAEVEAIFGGTDGVAFLNLLTGFDQLAAGFGGDGGGDAAGFNPAQLAQLAPAFLECNIGVQDLLTGDGFNFDPFVEGLISCPSTDVYAYYVEQDPTFGSRLNADVYALLPEDVLAIDGYAPLLGEVWTSLSDRPEFTTQALNTADDLLALGDDSAASVLNTINNQVTGQFVGYEVRLFDSLSPQVINYILEREADFFTTLDSNVLLKLSPDVLAIIPDDVLSNFDANVAQQAEAIANGEAESAAAQIASQYESDTPPARPDAPALNAEWQQLTTFYAGTEFNNAFDIIRFETILEGVPAQFINGLFSTPRGAAFAPDLLGNMPADAFYYIADEDPTFIETLSPRALNLFSEDVFNQLPEAAQERAAAGDVFVPDTQVTRTNGAPSLLVTIYKVADANTVSAFADVESIINTIDENNDSIAVEVAFEQATFIEESISGVVLSGVLGAFFAIVNILVFLSGDTWGGSGRRITGIIISVIAVAMLIGFFFISGQDLNAMIDGEAVLITALIIFGIFAGIIVLFFPGRLPFPAWRATVVIAVSIPLSIMSALALMNWLPGIMNNLLGGFDNAAVDFILRLAPEGLTLNIMTLSGLTVAVGRLVDDSIVVLENIFRQLQRSDMDKREAVLYATRDVSVAIFSATSIAVLVFLPLGLTGGLTAEFFLPFGLAVTYTLLSSFVVAITVVPVLAYFLISAENVPADEESWMEKAYVPLLRGVLSTNLSRILVLVFALASVGLSGYLFSQRPATFLPDFGEPQISISVAMPEGTGIIDTNARVEEVEDVVRNIIPADDLVTLRTIVGGGGLDFSALFSGGGVSENLADVTVSVDSSDNFESYVLELEEALMPLVTTEEESITVAAGAATGGGFGGFELQVSGAPLADLDAANLQALNADVIAALVALPELEEVNSSLPVAENADEDTPITFIRVCSDGGCSPALTFGGEPDTEDTINFTTTAIEAIEENVEFPEGVTVGQGFDSELQTQGFSSIFVAMGIALSLIVIILIVVFRSPVYWLAVLFSVIVAPVGAAIALTLTDRVLGISSLIGLLMLLGLVVTNAIVLIDRVGSNRQERGMNLYDALVEAGGRRLRPILMTALTTIIGLIPLALGLSEGAIIAAELGTVVIGGIISSTLLMLLVVPAAYYLFTPFHDFFLGLFGSNNTNSEPTPSPEKPKS